MIDLMNTFPSDDSTSVTYARSLLEQFITHDQDPTAADESTSNVYRLTLPVIHPMTGHRGGYLVVEYSFTPPNSSETLFLQLLLATLKIFLEKSAARFPFLSLTNLTPQPQTPPDSCLQATSRTRTQIFRTSEIR
jgi:hypothetical protein